MRKRAQYPHSDRCYYDSISISPPQWCFLKKFGFWHFLPICSKKKKKIGYFFSTYTLAFYEQFMYNEITYIIH